MERKETEEIDDFVRNTFIYLFETDITEQLSMEDKWKNRTPPITIKYNAIESEVNKLRKSDEKQQNPMRVWSVEENAASFMKTMSELVRRKEECSELVFDKDDNLAMEFVSSAANLRMQCYHIGTKSPFDNKGIAGNIIHAIATTNAITAGCMVVQAVHILKRNHNLNMKSVQQNGDEMESKSAENTENGINTKSVENTQITEDKEAAVRALPTRVCWVNSKGRRWLYPQMMETPNPKCFICQKSVVHLTLNPKLFDYGNFVKRILQKHLGFKQPDIAIEFVDPTDASGTKRGSNLLESVTEGDDEEERKEKMELVNKPLDDPRIKIYDQSTLSIDDFSQDVQVNLVVHYMDLDEEKHPQGFELTNTWSASKFTLATKQSGGGSVGAITPGNEETVTVADKEQNERSEQSKSNGDISACAKVCGKKRKMDDIATDKGDSKTMEIEPPSKKAKTGN